MMKKIAFITAISFLLITACFLLHDGWIYVLATLMSLPVIVMILNNWRWTTNITRWAKSNVLKAQLLITLLQVVLLFVAIVVGYNFGKLKYHISDMVPIVCSMMLFVGLFSVPLLPKAKLIVTPCQVNKQRFVFLGIVLSSFVLLMTYGSRLEENHPNSPITYAVKAIDGFVFSEEAYKEEVAQHYNEHDSRLGEANNEPSALITHVSFPSKEMPTMSEKKASRLEKKMLKRFEKYRLAFAGGLGVGAILLSVLLVFTSCAGICLILLSGGAVGTIFAGAALLGASIWGIIKIFKNKRNS